VGYLSRYHALTFLHLLPDHDAHVRQNGTSLSCVYHIECHIAYHVVIDIVDRSAPLVSDLGFYAAAMLGHLAAYDIGHRAEKAGVSTWGQLQRKEHL